MPCLTLLFLTQQLRHFLVSLSSVSCLAEEPADGHDLSHIEQLEDNSDSGDLISINSRDSNETFSPKKSRPAVLISNGFPPIPFRLVKRVEDGLFVEMSELLPSYLDSADLNSNDQCVSSRRRPPAVSNIVDWIQCFAVYIAIISRQKPKRVADLLGYQSLIIGASMHCHEGKWVVYDCRFLPQSVGLSLRAMVNHRRDTMEHDLS